MTRIARRLALSLVLAVAAVLGLGAAPASAAAYWWTGSPGPSSTYQGVCRYQAGAGTLSVSTVAPLIYARDYRAGGGNDSQWVRFRSVLVDNATGQAYRTAAFSGWSMAYDNVPASFSGVQLFENIPNNSRIDIRIEWWDSTRMLGAVAHSVTSYQHYSGRVGPYSSLTFCSKW